ncbi:AraC-like DNA-binding protein [Methylobacterium sp. 1030]
MLEAMVFGPFSITRVTQSAIRTEITPTFGQHKLNGNIARISIQLSGTITWTMRGQKSIQRPGDFMVIDITTAEMTSEARSRTLVLELPRERLTRILGPVPIYAGLIVSKNQLTASLATNYIKKLTKIGGQLNPELVTRLSSIAIDLLVAGLSERIAQETPRSLAGTLLLQRAKAYIDAHLGDPSLNPQRLANVMRISLRRLQQLFQLRNENISGFILDRRMELAATMLADSVHAPKSISAVAYACGFISQSHFSTRFKERYGMSPRDYRDKTKHQ